MDGVAARGDDGSFASTCPTRIHASVMRPVRKDHWMRKAPPCPPATHPPQRALHVKRTAIESGGLTSGSVPARKTTKQCFPPPLASSSARDVARRSTLSPICEGRDPTLETIAGERQELQNVVTLKTREWIIAYRPPRQRPRGLARVAAQLQRASWLGALARRRPLARWCIRALTHNAGPRVSTWRSTVEATQPRGTAEVPKDGTSHSNSTLARSTTAGTEQRP